MKMWRTGKKWQLDCFVTGVGPLIPLDFQVVIVEMHQLLNTSNSIVEDMSDDAGSVMISNSNQEQMCLDNTNNDYLLYTCVKLYLSWRENNVVFTPHETPIPGKQLIINDVTSSSFEDHLISIGDEFC